MAWLDAVVHGLVQGMQGFQVVVSRRGVVKIESSPWKVCLMLCWLSEWKQRYRVRIARPSGKGRCEGRRSIADTKLTQRYRVRIARQAREDWCSVSQEGFSQFSRFSCVLQNPMLTRIRGVSEGIYLHRLAVELSSD